MEKTNSDNIKVGTGAIIIKDGRTLLAKRKNMAHGAGLWGSTGGHVEFGETPAQAAIREAKEELGIVIGNLRFLACLDERFLNGRQYVDVIFLADIVSGEPAPMEPDKVEEVAWFLLDELPEPMFGPVKLALECYKAKIEQQYFEFKE